MFLYLDQTCNTSDRVLGNELYAKIMETVDGFLTKWVTCSPNVGNHFSLPHSNNSIESHFQKNHAPCELFRRSEAVIIKDLFVATCLSNLLILPQAQLRPFCVRDRQIRSLQLIQPTRLW